MNSAATTAADPQQRQRDALARVLADLAARERMAPSPRGRGWKVEPLPADATLPDGALPAAILRPTRSRQGEAVALAVDAEGRVRMVEPGAQHGPPITVAEAAAMARGD